VKTEQRDPITTVEADTIEVSYSHQVKINGDESWMGFKYTTVVRVEETLEEATARAVLAADKGVWHAIEESVATIHRKVSA
jgi:hypothetical protein